MPDDDYPPFYGGARISTTIFSTCTTGFAWTAGTNKSMLFAGHCALAGGQVSYPSFPNVGTVSSTAEENWSKTTGTTFFTGEGVFRGDLALIRYSSQLATGRVYTGGTGTATNLDVSAYGWSAVGDSVCVNGVADGENCGAVHTLGVTIHYTAQGPAVQGDNVWLRNAIEAYPGEWNQCPIPGDSGAPAYKRKADGTLLAKGIHSGVSSGPLGCSFYYTDIMEAYHGLPGTVQT